MPFHYSPDPAFTRFVDDGRICLSSNACRGGAPAGQLSPLPPSRPIVSLRAAISRHAAALAVGRETKTGCGVWPDSACRWAANLTALA